MPRKYNKRDLMFWREKERGSRKGKKENKLVRAGKWIKENPLEATLAGVATAATVRYGGKAGLKALKKKGAPVKDRIGGFFQDAAEAVGEDRLQLKRWGDLAAGMSVETANRRYKERKMGALGKSIAKKAKGKKGTPKATEEQGDYLETLDTSNTKGKEKDLTGKAVPKKGKQPDNKGDGVSHTPQESKLGTDSKTKAATENKESGGTYNRESSEKPESGTGSTTGKGEKSPLAQAISEQKAAAKRVAKDNPEQKTPSARERKYENYEQSIARLKRLTDPNRPLKSKKVNVQKRRKQLRRRLAAIEQSYATKQPKRYTRPKNYKVEELDKEAKKRFQKNALDILGWDKDTFGSDLLFLTDFRDVRSDKGKKRGKYKTRKKKYTVDPKEKDVGDMTQEEYKRSLAERRLKAKKMELPTKMFREVVSPVASLAREIRGVPRALLYLKELRGVKEPAKKTKELRQKLGALRDIKGLAGL